MEYRDAIKGKETRQEWASERDAVVQWMMATYFELRSLARIKFAPHKPYIVATFTVCLVKWEYNGERILYVDGQRSIIKLVSWTNVQVLDFTQCSHNWNRVDGTCLWNKSYLCIIQGSTLVLRDNIGLLWRNFTPASDLSSKYVDLINNCTTASRSLGHPCLVSLLFVASLYIFHTFLIHFFIYVLVSIPFLLHSYAWCAMKFWA